MGINLAKINLLELESINLKYPIKPTSELGSQGRLGIRNFIDDFYISRMIDDNEEMIDRIRVMMRRELSAEVFDHVAIRPNPVTVRVVETTHRAYSPSSGVYIDLICDLQDVETMKNFYLPPFEFHTYNTNTSDMVIEWQCLYCGSCNIVSEHLECRKCGASRKPMR